MSSETFTGGVPLSQSEKQSIQIISPTKQEQEEEINLSLEPISTVTEVEPTEEPISFTGGEDIKVSNLEKLEYAFDKNTQILGNIYRIGKAKVQDIFDDEKGFKDYILENEALRQKDIQKEHWKFATGKYDDDAIVKAGEIATVVLDPGFILAYATPWGRAALKSYKMAALMGGVTISADVALRDLATTGEIDFGKVGVAGAIGTALGPIGPAVSKIFKKFAPQATQKQVDEVVTYLDNKIANNSNITVPQLKSLRNVANDKEVVKASENIIKWSNTNFIAPISAETSKFKILEKTLLDKRNTLIELRKLRGGKKPKPNVPGMVGQESIGKQIMSIRSKLNEATKTLEKNKAEIYKTQQPKIKKYAELIAKRDGLILEKLRATESNIDWAVRNVLSVSVKPLIGGATGLTAGVLFGDEDTKLMNWFTAGAVMGATQKYIQGSKKFVLGDKNKILGIIDSEATKYTLQEIRALTASTSSTKLEAYGGATEQVGKLLLETIDSSVSQKSVVANADRLSREFTTKAYNLVKPYTAEEQVAAISIVRGKQLTKDTPAKVEELATGIKNYLEDFKKVYNDAGFFSKTEIQDYFPRVFNWEKINTNPDAFKKTLEGIFTSLKYKNPKKAAETYFQGHRNNTDSVFNREILAEIFTGSRKIPGVTKSKYGKEFVYTPISEHISQERSLNGSYKLVEEVLEKNGYLVNDAASILTNIVNKSMKSIAFTRQFGENGQLLKPFFEQIKRKYEDLGFTAEKANMAAAKEGTLLADTIDAYFDRYGKQVDGLWRSSAAILSTLSNLNMLGRVTISSLGDIVQPFQNSTQFSSWFKALPVVGQRGIKTAFTISGEEGIAKELNLGITNEIRQGLLKPLGVDSSNVITNTSWMGETFTQKTNNYAFKFLGLEWLTGFARRFAYNVGAGDAYGLSKSLAKMVKNNIPIDKGKGLKVVQDLSRYNIKPQTALRMAETNSIEEAIKNSTFKEALNRAGITTSNRDALIPQVSNRLLFTQSQNPWARLMGQFMSWAMAKSAQTNKILQRIENGNTKTLIKVLAAIPIYGGIQGLREFAKYGEVVTDFGPDTKRWFAEAFRLSGMQGYLPDLFINKTVGPSSREPWYQFAPAFQVARGAGEVVQSALLGDFEKALRKFSQDIAPFPEWQNWIKTLWGRETIRDTVPIKGGKLSPLKLQTGDIATLGLANINNQLVENEKQEIDLVKEKSEPQLSKAEIKKEAEKNMTEGFPTYTNKEGKEISLQQMQKEISKEGNKNMNIKDAAKVAVVAGTLATNVNAQVDKAFDKTVMPKQKPKVEKVIKLPDLTPEKKKFLLETASTIYQNNVDEKIPSDILLAIAIEETGYGTSRFFKEGNNYFNIIAEKDDNFIKAKGDNTRVARFEVPSESIEKFYTWVETKPHYENVRKTIDDYQKGEATKDDIVDAISETGWAENPDWSLNVKSILKNRVNDKHAKELLSLKESLFKK